MESMPKGKGTCLDDGECGVDEVVGMVLVGGWMGGMVVLVGVHLAGTVLVSGSFVSNMNARKTMCQKRDNYGQKDYLFFPHLILAFHSPPSLSATRPPAYADSPPPPRITAA
jgi:hypothetical protein